MHMPSLRHFFFLILILPNIFGSIELIKKQRTEKTKGFPSSVSISNTENNQQTGLLITSLPSPRECSQQNEGQSDYDYNYDSGYFSNESFDYKVSKVNRNSCNKPSGRRSPRPCTRNFPNKLKSVEADKTVSIVAKSEGFRKRKLLEIKNTLNKFEYYKELCNDGNYHKLPHKFNLIFCEDPSDYLGLAIRAQDYEAISFCKDFVVLQKSSCFLQSALIDVIINEQVGLISALGIIFPSIFTTSYAFHPPYDNLSGTSLFRIAVERKKRKVANAMLKFIPLSKIGFFWQTIDSMKNFILDSLHNGEIGLTPHLPGDTGLDKATLIDIYLNCVLRGDVEAMIYLLENTNVPIDTIFISPNDVTLSAMYMAAHAGNLEIVKYLYTKCPSLAKVPNHFGLFPIHIASGNGNLDMIQVLSADYESLTSEVCLNGLMYTPFSLAIRNKKRNAADLIISYIRNLDINLFEKEIKRLVYYAILDDDVSILDIYFEYKTFPPNGFVDEKFNLLEMAILGIINPSNSDSSLRFSNKKSSINCVNRLIYEWKKRGLPFTVDYEGTISGNILGIVYPYDIDAFNSLIKYGGVDPNGSISVTVKSSRDKSPRVLRTTFLNQIIALGASEMIPFAISKGCDPRLIDGDGNDAIEIAEKYKNSFALEFFKRILQDTDI